MKYFSNSENSGKQEIIEIKCLFKASRNKTILKNTGSFSSFISFTIKRTVPHFDDAIGGDFYRRRIENYL